MTTIQAPRERRAPTPDHRGGDALLPTPSARITIATTHSAATPLDPEPRPEFLEMVGRLASAYCPPLLSTDIVDIARSALAERAGDQMDEVETLARAALDTALHSALPPATALPPALHQPVGHSPSGKTQL